jgi:hypothetical protein
MRFFMDRIFFAIFVIAIIVNVIGKILKSFNRDSQNKMNPPESRISQHPGSGSQPQKGISAQRDPGSGPVTLEDLYKRAQTRAKVKRSSKDSKFQPLPLIATDPPVSRKPVFEPVSKSSPPPPASPQELFDRIVNQLTCKEEPLRPVQKKSVNKPVKKVQKKQGIRKNELVRKKMQSLKKTGQVSVKKSLQSKRRKPHILANLNQWQKAIILHELLQRPKALRKK